MQELLDEIYSITLSDRKECEEKRKHGDLFNVFSILGLSSNEVRTHSAFLAELLNPEGTHGVKDKFLKLFLSSMDAFKDFCFNTSKAKVFVELSTGIINDDATEGGRVDIIIKSGRKVIVIENKIYAGDQEKQLLRYSNYCSQFEDYRLLYLTLDGHEASEFSTGDKTINVDYYPISYEHEIVHWLELCMKTCQDRELVHYSIKQYSNLIKELTGHMSNEDNEKKIMELLTSKENANKTAVILDRYNDLKYEFEDRYVTQKVKEWARRQGLVYSDEISDCWFLLTPPEWKHHSIALWFSRTNFDFGIRRNSGRAHKQMQLSMLESGINDGWPFGWQRRSDVFNSVEKIVNGEALKFIKDTTKAILAELDERKAELAEKNIEL